MTKVGAAAQRARPVALVTSSANVHWSHVSAPLPSTPCRTYVPLELAGAKVDAHAARTLGPRSAETTVEALSVANPRTPVPILDEVATTWRVAAVAVMLPWTVAAAVT